jgi:hypothetical protein
MIFFVVPQKDSFGFRAYLLGHGKALAERANLLFYPEIPHLRRLPLGSYVFTALDMLSPAETEMVIQIWDHLSQAGQDVRLLNDPRRALTRYQLLRSLSEAGRNRFRACRASEWRRCNRFPVFVRQEKEHTGSLTSLLETPAALNKALVWLVVRGHRLRDLLIVEYCDTSDENGVFRKYSAYVVGGKVIARGIIFSDHWMTKDHVRQFNEQWLEEEHRYVQQNPHEPWLKEVFHLAGIEYGRIDYGLQGDMPQVWEINMHPTLAGGGGPGTLLGQQWYNDLRIPMRDHFNRQFRAAWETIDCSLEPMPGIPLPICPKLRQRIRVEQEQERRATTYKTFVDRLARNRLLRRAFRKEPL